MINTMDYINKLGINADQITKYKDKVRKKLIKSNELLDLIFNEQNIVVEDSDIDEFICPQVFFPDDVEKEVSFILFDVDIPHITDGIITTSYLCINVYVHKNLIKVGWGFGNRPDRISFEIMKLLNNGDLGIGLNTLRSCVVNRSEHKNFYKRSLVYEIKDFDFLKIFRERKW